ncbi:MAG: MFS transporter [Acidithiobacillus sp.]|nr:MFS transporter [Acidithiobacillus sp.]
MTQILDQSHLQAIHYRLWILSTAGPLLSGVSMMVLGISVPLLRHSFSLSPELIGFIAASLMGGTVIGALLSGHLADRFGRRPLLIINPFVMILGGLCLGLAVHAAWLIVGELLLGMAIGLIVVWKSASDHWLVDVLLFGFALYNFTMNAGPNATTYILPTEMYPTQVRALGSGFAAAFAKIGATLAVFMLPILQSQLGVYTVLLAVAMLSLLAALLTYSFRVEGHGLTLEEHQGVTSLRRRQIPL